MTELFLKIEAVEQVGDDITDYRDALCELSRHDSATYALTGELIRAVLEEERQWREIEQREDYKARYTSRVKAREDFLHEYFHKGNIT